MDGNRDWMCTASAENLPTGVTVLALFGAEARAVATRYDKLTVRYQATLHIAAIAEWLRPLTS